MKIKNLFIAVFASLFFFISCTDGDDSLNEMGKLTVQLTDAPFPHDLVAEANVTIFKVDARNKGSEKEMDDESESNDEMEGESDSDDEMEDESDSSDEENDNSPFVTLMEREIEVNLLELINGNTETLVDTFVPVGTYDLIRVYVKGVSIVLTDGTIYDLKVPSGEQTGIKVFIKPGIVVNGGLSADLILDFDVSKSFIPKGNRKDFSGITGFNFKPVIKACNKSTSGTLSGLIYTVQEATELVEETPTRLGGAQIEIYEVGTINTSTSSITSTSSLEDTGAYKVMGLTAGTYDVVVMLEGYEVNTVEGVQISAANTTTQDFNMKVIP